jgi:radical SAM enzyme (TIGR01210 family)
MKKLTEITQFLRSMTPKSAATKIAKGSEIWPYYDRGQEKERVIIFLRSSGCMWVKKSGGCTMCQHAWEGTTQGVSISVADYITQFETEFCKYTFSDHLSGICVFNEGNFFNEEELPREARLHILKRIAVEEKITHVTFETLPEFMDPSSILDMEMLTSLGKDVLVGVGLESAHPDVRKIINKPFSLRTYEKAVAELHVIGARVLAYVLVKPPFLTEHEALEDAISTVKYAFSVGTDIVSLEPINIGEFTVAGILYKKGLYRAPWLWTTLCVALRSSSALSKKEIRIGGAQYKPNYMLVPHNCEKCNDHIALVIDDWNKHQDASILSNALCANTCECQRDWEIDLELKEEISLLERPEIYL